MRGRTFGLNIALEGEKNGQIDYALTVENRGIPDEVLIVIVGIWLQQAKETYHDRFKHGVE
jgi:hypothetical protein